MLAVQTFSVTCLFFWGLIATLPIIWLVDKMTPIRLSAEDEIKGCDIVEHYMGDEKDVLQPLEQIQFGSPIVNFNIPSNIRNNESFKEFNTVGKRRQFHTNLTNVRENHEQPNASERL